jgi:hypothetical protein
VNKETETMAREVVKKETAAPVANLQKNFFEQYGEQVASSTSIVGSLLKFSKGDWLLGQDETEIPTGTKYVASMDNLLVGWTKWSNNKPVDEVMGLVCEGWSAPKRDTLGDTDQSQWEMDAQGKLRDPWVFNNRILFKPVGKKYSTDVAITFITNSRGGLNAMGDLSKAYGKEMASHEGQNPIIQIGTDSYLHPNKEFGRIKIPLITLVGWERGDLFDTTPVDDDDDGAEQIVETKKKANGRRR